MKSSLPIIIAIIDDYQNFVVQLDAYAELKAELPHADIRIVSQQPLDNDAINALKDVHYLVLIRERTRVDAGLLDRLPALKAIVQTGTIGDPSTSHVDAQACAQRGIAILEGKSSDGHAAAELTWALILNAARHVPAYMDSLNAGNWHRGAQTPLGQSVRGRVLGILGYGRIGQLLGRYGKAFGMDVVVWGRENSRVAAQADGVRFSESRAELFSHSDVLALQLRLNAQTRHGVTREDLAAMKPTSLLVNTSRPSLIAPGALVAALRLGRPGRAAVDVHEHEPQFEASPLSALPNCIATPHIGYVERNSYEILFAASFKKLVEHAKCAPG